jgi:hypothetical protein
MGRPLLIGRHRRLPNACLDGFIIPLASPVVGYGNKSGRKSRAPALAAQQDKTAGQTELPHQRLHNGKNILGRSIG